MPATLQPEVLSTSAQLDALLHHAAVAPLPDIGWIRVTGADRVRWLNGMVTNSIQSLAPGEGNYNFALNAQGRIQADLTAFALADSILLETTEAGKLATLLDHFIIMDDVELTDVTSERAGLMVAGPQAISILQILGIYKEQPATPALNFSTWRGAPIEIIHAHSPLIPRFELWSDPTTIASLTTALTTAGATPITPEALAEAQAHRLTLKYPGGTATPTSLPYPIA